jgi:mRNA interferase RelE/StbE
VNEALWRIELTRTAQRDLRRLDPPVRRRVVEALTALAADPQANSSLRRLSGRPESRLRVGDWRVILDLEPRDRVVLVVRVLPRGRAYRD